MNVLYFPQESTYEKIAYETNVENGIYPISAVIHHVDKVNENLYAVSLNVTMANTEQSGNEVFNFVAKVDDQWRYILACTNIPKEIVGDSDLSEYWYPDNDYVSLDDVLK